MYRYRSRQSSHPGDEYVCSLILQLGRISLKLVSEKKSMDYNAEDKTTPASSTLQLPQNTPSTETTALMLTSGKEHLLLLARSQHPQILRSKYTKVVETCLTCLDTGKDTFGDEEEFEDDDGVHVGARYVEQVRTLQLLDVLRS